MPKNPILDLPLTDVIRAEIALPLQQILNLPTVGSLLGAWGNPRNHRSIEQVFDTPKQARQAVSVCAAWVGVNMPVTTDFVPAWWH